MDQIGTTAIWLGVAVSAYAAITSLVGAKGAVPELVVSGRRAVYMAFLVALVASAALLIAFLTNDFSIKYVANNSNIVMGRGYTLVAFYAANEGSLLYITLALALMSAISVRLAPRRFAGAMPYTVAILAVVLAFLFGTMATYANPFETLEIVPPDGRGVNPLLLHPGFYSHPPLIMAGLVGITIPFAFASGALISGEYGDDWVDIARVFAIIMWGILGVGILLGAWWAYTILGWGGYWSWDPIENVALMPWLVLTAFIHSIMVQRRRGMFRMWNIVLIDVAFILAQLGMSINRGGSVVSVHSFAESTLGLLFLSFMAISLLFAFAIFIWRYPRLKSERAIESFMSRESSFLVNNFLLLVVMSITLWGVIYPVFSNLARDVDVSISAPYFNRVNGPVLLLTVIVMGIGPLLPWRRTSTRSLNRWLMAPLIAASLTVIVLVAFGVWEFWAVLGFAAVTFAGVAVFEEWWMGARARVSNLGETPWSAWWRLVNGNRPRHGGYIVHVAVLSLAIGVIGTQFFDQRYDAAIAPGESLVLDDYRIEYVDNRVHDRPDRLARWAQIDVYRIDPAQYSGEFSAAKDAGKQGFTVATGRRPGDNFVGQLEPSHEFFRNFNMVSVRSGIKTSPIEDLYVIPRDFLEDERVSLAVSINPLAMWLWIAGPIFLLGTLVALWPHPTLERVARRRRMGVTVPTDAPTTAMES
ncbi:MAG: cytochrome c biogenesis protein CcsA [Chloroflexi bacterium]|nr:cytochrome c biogenesis protein CcsA [Chloroflexota bacterium]